MQLYHTLSVFTCFVLCGVLLINVRAPWTFKLGMMMFWLGSGYLVYGLSNNSIPAGLVALLAWVFVPAYEIIFILRRLRVPKVRELTDARAPEDDYDEIAEISEELLQLGFVQVDECRLNPSPHPHYYRLFVGREGAVHATIGHVSQDAIGFQFIAFSSQSHDGRRWVTWDYPLAYGLVMPPEIAVYRVLTAESLEDLLQAHLAFLEANEISEDQIITTDTSREAVRARLEKTLSRQIEYNVSHGFLAADPQEGDNFRYSWRGTWFVATQVIRDIFSF